MAIAYLTNSFPEPVEAYVWEEVQELRGQGATVITASMRRPKSPAPEGAAMASETVYAFPLRPLACVKANWLLLRNLPQIWDLLWRVFCGSESAMKKLRTILHTWLGAYLAALLKGSDVSHIHVHHGYFSSWSGMIAARILRARFSMTLHGSDLLVRADYIETKLAECRFCFTISEFNRRYILAHYASVAPSKVLVQHLGIDPARWRKQPSDGKDKLPSILSVGRLHAVKNHGFLLLACRALKNCGVQFRCTIAGDGEERGRLQTLITTLQLQDEVTLLGHVPRRELPALYAGADAIVLTSHSEGIPVTLMEAMSMERLVIAPRISGIPELVVDGENGFLYDPDCMDDFLDKLRMVIRFGSALENVRRAARRQIVLNFNAHTNLADFAFHFLQRVETRPTRQVLSETDSHENSLLQQI